MITVRMIGLMVCLEVIFKNRKCFRFYFRLNFRFLNYLIDYGPNDRSEVMFRSDFKKPEVLPVIFPVYFRSFFRLELSSQTDSGSNEVFYTGLCIKIFFVDFFRFFFKS